MGIIFGLLALIAIVGFVAAGVVLFVANIWWIGPLILLLMVAEWLFRIGKTA